MKKSTTLCNENDSRFGQMHKDQFAFRRFYRLDVLATFGKFLFQIQWNIQGQKLGWWNESIGRLSETVHMGQSNGKQYKELHQHVCNK